MYREPPIHEDAAHPRKPTHALLFASVILGYGSSMLGLLAVAISATETAAIILGVLWAMALALALAAYYVFARDWTIDEWVPVLRAGADALVLVVFVAWCVFWNHLAPDCGVSTCSEEVHKALAEPDILGLLLVHGATAGAYFVSRARSAPFPVHAEAVTRTLLAFGLVLHAALTIHLRLLPLRGLLFPWFIPLSAPVFAVLLYGRELLRTSRLSWPQGRPRPGFRRAVLIRVSALTAMLLGAGFGLRPALGWSPLRVFTHTCGHTFSAITTPPLRPSWECDEHVHQDVSRGRKTTTTPPRHQM